MEGSTTTSFDFGALVGAGASIGLGGRARFGFDTMYNDGLKSIVPNEVQDPNKNQGLHDDRELLAHDPWLRSASLPISIGPEPDRWEGASPDPDGELRYWEER